jgi:uncharacterized membrane protein YkvA (DUF1232 family)
MPRHVSGEKRPRKPTAKDTTTPLLDPRDVRFYLLESAAKIAPADVQTLLAQADDVRQKAARDDLRHELFHRQIDLALQLLNDHAAEECTQIPYHTVSLLAAALFYWLEPMDFIPDFIPGIGTTDDALVLELAYELAAPGVERYCRFKDIPIDWVLPKRVATSPKRPTRNRDAHRPSKL